MITKCNKCQPCCPGAISPIPATDDMMVPVGVRDGQLYTERQGIPEFGDSDVGSVLEVKQTDDQTYAGWSKKIPQRIDDIEQKQTVDELAIDELIETTGALTPRYKAITLLMTDWVLDEDTGLYGLTASVTGVKLGVNSAVIVSPAVSTRDAYLTAGVVCYDQRANELDFQASTIPTADVDVNVIVLNGEAV